MKQLAADERRVFARLTSPAKIQEFIDALPYSSESRYRSPRSVLRDRTAHCYDGAVFAAAALRFIGHPPVLVELLPTDQDDDHILAIFHRGTCWGALAKSNFVGLRYREPIYRSLRELVLSYFESYYNVAGQRTLRGYTAPLALTRFDSHDWLRRDEAMETIGTAMEFLRMYTLITPAMARKLTPMDSRSYNAGLAGARRSGLYKPEK